MEYFRFTYNRFLPLMVLLLVSYNSFGEVDNLREACRRRVAGEHLKYLDKLNLARKKLDYTENQTSGLTLRIQEIEGKIKQMELELQRDELNFELREQINEYENLSSYYQEIVTSNKTRKINLTQLIKTSEKELNSFVQNIKPAFKVVKYKSKNSYGYPLEIKYEVDCPQYNTSCPVDRKSKDAILRAFSKDQQPESCLRYIRQN